MNDTALNDYTVFTGDQSFTVIEIEVFTLTEEIWSIDIWAGQLMFSCVLNDSNLVWVEVNPVGLPSNSVRLFHIAKMIQECRSMESKLLLHRPRGWQPLVNQSSMIASMVFWSITLLCRIYRLDIKVNPFHFRKWIRHSQSRRDLISQLKLRVHSWGHCAFSVINTSESHASAHTDVESAEAVHCETRFGDQFSEGIELKSWLLVIWAVQQGWRFYMSRQAVDGEPRYECSHRPIAERSAWTTQIWLAEPRRFWPFRRENRQSTSRLWRGREKPGRLLPFCDENAILSTG
jgi:hypothetical protein